MGSFPSVPDFSTLAKNARMGHPSFVVLPGKTDKDGPPALSPYFRPKVSASSVF
jgi:hypothetical protein